MASIYENYEMIDFNLSIMWFEAHKNDKKSQ